MNMNFKELLGKVTPGKWTLGAKIPKFIFSSAKERDDGKSALAEILTQDWDVKNPQITAETAAANAQYIARCSPANMALVLEALESSRDTAEFERHPYRACQDKVKAALTALNSPTP